MKTQKKVSSKQSKIKDAKILINELGESNVKLYDSLKDFKLSANKTNLVLAKMISNNSLIKKQQNIIIKLQ